MNGKITKTKGKYHEQKEETSLNTRTIDATVLSFF
jgi:hypothetical protein